jgi:hypothetical protein
MEFEANDTKYFINPSAFAYMTEKDGKVTLVLNNGKEIPFPGDRAAFNAVMSGHVQV